MSNPIAVFINAFNEDKYLEKTLQSLISQTFDEFDIIVSDNHSTDRTSQIINDFKLMDGRVISWKPDRFLKSQEHGIWAINKVNAMNYEASLYIGGHDVVSHNYIEALYGTLKKNPSAAIVFPEGMEIDIHGRILRKWPDIPSLYINPFSRRFNSLILLFSIIYNIPLFGLWRSSVRRAVTLRHACVGIDHLLVAEAALYGDVICESNATIMTRRTEGAGDLKVYFQKHISDELQAQTIAEDFDKQLEWVSYIAETAFADFPDAVRNIYRASALGSYFSRYGITNLGIVDGALEYWLNSETGRIIASQLSNTGAAAALTLGQISLLD